MRLKQKFIMEQEIDETNIHNQTVSMSSYQSSVKPALVLDLDDTIIYSTMIKTQKFSFSIKIGNHRKAYIQTRPGLYEFIKEVSPLFDIFFFTSSSCFYGNQIINTIAPETPEKRRLFRESCKNIYGYSVKDLSLISKPMNKILLVDDMKGSALLNQDNLVHISPWEGNQEDNVLLDQLLPILVRIKEESNLPIAFKKIIKSGDFKDIRSFKT